MSPHRIEYNSSALTGDDYRKKIDAAQSFCAQNAITFGIQIHNIAPLAQIERLHATGAPLSFHAPTDCEYLINLANADFSYAHQSITRTAELITQFGGDLAVFHSFLMTDYPVLAFNMQRSYETCLAPALRGEFTHPGTTLCADFLATDEYQQRWQRVKEHLAQIQTEFPTITWCIENDYPANGAGLLLAEQAVALNAPFCLDISHLWIACLLFKKDFFQQAELIAQTGRVKCVHFHANPTPRDAPITDYRDGHLPLDTPNAMNLPRLARTLANHGVNHWTFEFARATTADIQLLNDWIR